MVPNLTVFTALALFHGIAKAVIPTESTHRTLAFTSSVNISRVTVNHPPINLFDDCLASDMLDFLTAIQTKPYPKVVIIDSAVPGFWIDHIDLNNVVTPMTPSKAAFLGKLGQVTEFFRNTTTTVFIGEINGNAIGAGGEISSQLDLRYAGPHAKLGQPEISIGALSSGGTIQALPLLTGRGRAMEFILSGNSIHADEGAAIGLFNKAFGDEKQLKQAVDAIARRIAQNPASGINATKTSALSSLPPASSYQKNVEIFENLLGESAVQAGIMRTIELGNNQTRSAFEEGLDDTLVNIFD